MANVTGSRSGARRSAPPVGQTCIHNVTGILKPATAVSECAVSRAFAVVGRLAWVVGRARGDEQERRRSRFDTRIRARWHIGRRAAL
jgi:hypothetical protein